MITFFKIRNETIDFTRIKCVGTTMTFENENVKLDTLTKIGTLLSHCDQDIDEFEKITEVIVDNGINNSAPETPVDMFVNNQVISCLVELLTTNKNVNCKEKVVNKALIFLSTIIMSAKKDKSIKLLNHTMQ